MYLPAKSTSEQRESKHCFRQGIDGLLIIQRVDLFYFSGTAQNGFLYVPADGAPLLLIKKYLPRAQAESTVENIVHIRSIKEIPEKIAAFYERQPRLIGLEFDVLPVAYFLKLKNLFDGVEFVDAAPLILKTRMRKSVWEIEQMQKTAILSKKTFEYMQTAIRPGFSEIEFSGMFEAFARKHGHGAMLRIRNFLTEGYTWHLLSGRSGGRVGLLDAPASGDGTSAAFPCGAGNKLIEKDEPIMIDFSSVMNGYHLDETRMFAIGSMPEPALKACHAAMDIHDTILENVKPGVSVGELFDISVDRAASLGVDEQYLGPCALNLYHRFPPNQAESSTSVIHGTVPQRILVAVWYFLSIQKTVKIILSASRADSRPTRSQWFIPLMLAFSA